MTEGDEIRETLASMEHAEAVALQLVALGEDATALRHQFELDRDFYGRAAADERWEPLHQRAMLALMRIDEAIKTNFPGRH